MNESIVPATGDLIYWYSFNYGGIHVIQMSSEHDWPKGSQQFEWIKQDLEKVDRKETPWVILTAHRMMVSFIRSGYTKSSIQKP